MKRDEMTDRMAAALRQLMEDYESLLVFTHYPPGFTLESLDVADALLHAYDVEKAGDNNGGAQ